MSGFLRVRRLASSPYRGSQVAIVIGGFSKATYLNVFAVKRNLPDIDFRRDELIGMYALNKSH